MDQMHLFHRGIDGVTCCKKHFMQGPLKASFIVAPSAEGKDLSNALRGFIGFGVCAMLNSPYTLEMRSCVCCIVCHLFPKSSTAAEIEAMLKRRSALSGAIRLRAQVVC